jgi:threonine synthase
MEHFGIWKHKEIREAFGNSNFSFITMDETDTPVQVLSDDKSKLFIKREDKNPTGSWKDRGTAYKLTKLLEEGYGEAVLSSSGNAAISFLTYANKIKNFALHIVVSKKIKPQKLQIIKELISPNTHQLYIVEQPRKFSVELSAKLKIPNLRASIDEDITKGYWSLGFELAKLFKDPKNADDAIFFGVSSGTAMVGAVQGLFMKIKDEALMPKCFVCQTQSVYPVVKALHPELNLQESDSIADSIIDSIALRSPQLLKIIRETDSDAYAISNTELLEAEKFANIKGITDMSHTSLLSLAGYLRAKNSGMNFKNAIIIASGL